MHHIWKKSILLWVIITGFVFGYDAKIGQDWLVDALNTSVYSSDKGDIAQATQSVRESVLALDKFGALSQIDKSSIISLFESTDSNDTEFLASKIIVYKILDEAFDSLLLRLESLQNDDGGFGHSKGYESTVLDTALALQAFSLASDNVDQYASTVEYLVSRQKPDGSWSDTINNDDSYVTSLAMHSLWLQRKVFDVQNALSRANTFLSSMPLSDETFLQALVLRSIAPLHYTKDEITERINALKTAQQSNGSWLDSIYTTALALQALYVADRNVPNPDLAAIRGIVVDGDTDVALSGIRVVLDNGSDMMTQQDGSFRFEGLKNGTYTLDILSDHYAPLHTSIRLMGDDVDLGRLRLSRDANATISTLTGFIKDNKTNRPIEGALVRAGNLETQTNHEGLYVISNIEAGTYMVSVVKVGYIQEERRLTVPANTILRYNVSLKDFDFTVSAKLMGMVVDENSSLPLNGAVVSLSDGNTTKTYTTTTTGKFDFQNLSQGAYHIKIQKDGYYVVQTTFSVNTSNTIDFGVIKLQPVDTTAPQFASVQGVVVEAISKKPIENALVEVSGLHTMTSATGRYSIKDIPVGEITLKITKDGYKSVGATATLSPGSTLIFSPALQKDDGVFKLYGTILDSNSSEPLPDVNISIVDTNLTTFTDMNGSYVIDNIPTGEITIEVSKLGYRTIKITTTVNDKNILFSPTLQRNGSINGTTTLHGRVVDTASDEVLADVRFYIDGIDTGIRSDSEGNFTIKNIDHTDINLTLRKDGYKDVNSLIALSEHQELDIGTLHMRAIGIEEFKPDLVAEAINTSGLVSDIHTLGVSGELNITVANRGTIPSEPFEILVFYDTDADGNYTEGTDRNIAKYNMEDTIEAGRSKMISLELNTTADFRDQPIYVYIDSKNENVELDENNTFSTAKSCGGKQGQIDLGICFDYSGSVSSYMHIQKNGLVQALRDPQKFPRDGSIRLMVLTGAGQAKIYLKPTIITELNADDVADILENTYFYGYDYMGNCLKTIADTWENMSENNQSSYRAVTLSGDGAWGPYYGNINQYMIDRDYAISHGVNVIDTIGIGYTNNAGLEAYVYPLPAGGDLGKVYYAKTSEDISNSLVNTFKKQTKIADLTLGKLNIIDNGTDQNISVKFTVGNAGVATIPSNINISVYEGDPAQNGVLLATKSLDSNLSFGESAIIEIENIALQEGGEIYVVGDYENNLVECTKKNNTISSIVSATSTLGDIEVQTDKSNYRANELVSISGKVKNPGRLSYNLTAQLILEDTSGNIIHSFDPQPLGVLASGEDKTIANEWNTTDTLVGTYIVRGVLTDSKGVVVDESNTTFDIVPDSLGGVAATLKLSTDRVLYHTTDSINIANFIRSVSINSVIKDARVVVEVKDSNGTVMKTETLQIGELLPLVTRESNSAYTYTRIAEGNYTVEATLYGNGSTVFATDSKTVRVQEDPRQALKGSVSLAWRSDNVGTIQTCGYRISNMGSSSFAALPLSLRIVDLNTSTVTYDNNVSVDINSTQTISGMSHIDTHGYRVQKYACALYARVKNSWMLLDSQIFHLTNTPPIANNDSVSTYRDEAVSVDILSNDTDAEDGTVKLASFQQAAHGTVIQEDNSTLRYSPKNGYIGTDSFSYTIVDSAGATDTATVTVEVLAPPIEIDGILSQKGKGRVLLLLDSCKKERCHRGSKGSRGHCGFGWLCYLKGSHNHKGSYGSKGSKGSHGFDGDKGSHGSKGSHNHGTVCAEPYGPRDALDVDRQQAYIEALLTALGYSYTVVTNEADFTAELRSGAYDSYVLLSETIKLSETIQKELREAVFKGEQLFVAGVHDNRNGYISEIANIEFRGHYSSVGTVEMVDGNYSYFESPLLYRSYPIRFYANDTTLIAHYNVNDCYGTAAALVMKEYGAGKFIFAGFDILAEASKEPGGEYALLLTEILQSLQNSTGVWQKGSVVPMTLTVENRGIATPIAIALKTSNNAILIDAVDANESNATQVLFREALMEENEQKEYYFWVKALQADSQVEIFADIVSLLDGEAEQQAQLTYKLNIGAEVDVMDILQNAGGISLQDKRDRKRLKKAIRYLNKFMPYRERKPKRALAYLLKATDYIEGIKEKERVRELRVKIDYLIRTIEIELNKAGE